MADLEHLKILEQGVEVWNKWRKGNSEVSPDLSGADLIGADLKDADLRRSYLTGTHLSHARLRNAFLGGALLGGADLRSADLRDAIITHANLNHADLREADFARATLRGAILSGADLSGAYLRAAGLSDTLLRGANLSGANLTSMVLSRAIIDGVNFTSCVMGHTTLAGIYLSEATGLESIRHISPSSIGIDTLYNSAGKLSEIFLRGCGVPESFIVQIPALVAAIRPIEFYSCFISYSSKDQEFAERLHADLQAKGVRVWFAPRDLPIGARIRPTIDESIRLHDKLLLVLSEASVTSQWVEQEVETALAREREQEGKTVLFPIRIDDAVMEVKSGWPALLKNTRNVGDFTRWKEHDSYREAFDRLLRDMRAEA